MNLPLETNDCLLKKLLRRNFFSSLTIVALCSAYSVAHAQWQVHGQILSDIGYQLFQENNQDQDVSDSLRTDPIAQLSTFFLDAQYGVKDKVTANMRLGFDTYTSPVLWDDKLFQNADPLELQILAAYADFKLHKNITMSFGKMPLHTLNATRDNPYSFTIDPSLNAITALKGYKMGWSTVANFYPIAFQASLWNQTPSQPIYAISREAFDELDSFSQIGPVWINEVITEEDYRDRFLKLGYGASLAFVPSEYDEIGSAFTASFLVSPLNEPLIVATVGALDADTSVGLSVFNYLSSYQAHYVAYWKTLALDLGIEYNQMSLQASKLFGSQDYPGSLVFQQEPSAIAYQALLAYTFANSSKGEEGYKFNRISGRFSEKPSGLTVGIGFGSKTQKDVFALLSTLGQNDWLESVYANTTGAGRLTDEYSTNEGSFQNRYRNINIDNTLSNGINGTDPTPYATLGNTNPQGSPEHAFEIKSKSLTLMMSYQFHKNIEWKNELTYTDHDKLIFGKDTVSDTNFDSAYVYSINWYKTATFRTQLSVMF